MSVDAVILAGGYSTRAHGFKMEFDIEGKTILQRCIEGFYDSCRKIIVVTGFKYEKIEKLATKALPANVKNIGTTKD